MNEMRKNHQRLFLEYKKVQEKARVEEKAILQRGDERKQQAISKKDEKIKKS